MLVVKVTWADALVIVGVVLVVLCAAVCKAWSWIRRRKNEAK